MSCGVGLRQGSDLMLLWLRHKLAAKALILPLAWAPQYVMGAALKRPKKNGVGIISIMQNKNHNPHSMADKKGTTNGS